MALPETSKRWLEQHPELKVVQSMKRRHDDHDYSDRCIYHIVLCVENRIPILGSLNAPDTNHKRAYIVPTSDGRLVEQCWNGITRHRPEIKILAFQLMPDHIHSVVFVERKMPYHLGHVINGFKTAVRKALRDYYEAQPRTAQTEQTSPSTMPSWHWEKGYYDTILRFQGQLKKMISYVHDNPQRLWIKREHPEHLTVKHNVFIDGTSVQVMGNLFLLNTPLKKVVQCSRRITEEQLSCEKERMLNLSKEGYVLVSACISPGEKQIMKAAFDLGGKQIIILENGFSPMQKPAGRQFDACKEGKLLLVAPWEHHNERRKITREQCLALNALAQKIVGQSVQSKTHE